MIQDRFPNLRPLASSLPLAKKVRVVTGCGISSVIYHVLRVGTLLCPAQFSFCEDLEVVESGFRPSSDFEAGDLKHLP